MIHECQTIAAIRVPGDTYFFTVNLLERRSDLLVRQIQALRAAVIHTRSQRPFPIDAWVVLPDHRHCVITLPSIDDDFSFSAFPFLY
jgi:putative transposase